MSAFSSPKQARCRASIGNALALLAACLLGGCVTTGVEVANTPPAGAPVAAKVTAQQCVLETVGKPDYESLRAKIPPGAELRSGAPALTNRDRPTAAEMALLDALNAELRECRTIALAETPPSRLAKLTELHAATETLWTDGAAGRLTWGQFNQRRSIIGRQVQALLTAPAPAATASPKQDLFALEHRSDDPQLRLRGRRQPGPGATFTIDSMNPSGSSYCGAMRHTAYCDPRR
jgi:hypothetical protein